MVEPSPLQGLDLPLSLRCVLRRRGFSSTSEAESFLSPGDLPPTRDHFPDLEQACTRLVKACRSRERVAICGDYDADGMTSTALLLRALAPLGAEPEPAIPSRMEEGYGLNPAMVQRLYDDGVRLLVTVDNGVAAREALELAASLSMQVIVTDHHTIPAQRPPMTALIHPATTPEGSPYRGLAGVGLAYVLAHAVADVLNKPEAIRVARDLFCIGTVADMAPLVGANRSWLLEGLNHLHRSECKGVQALQRLAGLGERPLTAEDIGFQLAPRINAVGRLGEPRLVVDLLAADDPDSAMALARRCDDYNRQRRDLCDAIEAEAVALVEAESSDALPSFLLLAQSHWHHGVIGIVAARLMERYHRPTALLAGDGDGSLRASVRGPIGFAVDRALSNCSDLLTRFGGLRSESVDRCNWRGHDPPRNRWVPVPKLGDCHLHHRPEERWGGDSAPSAAQQQCQSPRGASGFALTAGMRGERHWTPLPPAPRPPLQSRRRDPVAGGCNHHNGVRGPWLNRDRQPRADPPQASVPQGGPLH